MNKTKDTWTRLHDLAMVFLALAYGTDKILSDDELDTIVDALRGWRGDLKVEAVQETVIEAMAVFLEGNAGEEVVDCINSLKQTLDKDERIRALEDVVRVARADGIVLGSEQNLITVLANAWKIKSAGFDDEAESIGTNNRPDGWNLLNDIGLMYVVIAHGGDNKLEESEINAMIERMGQWQPDLDEEGVRSILRTALSYYASEPGSGALRDTVTSIKKSLPGPQRLAVLDDLIHIAGADGNVDDNEKEMIGSLAKTLEVGIRLAPTA